MKNILKYLSAALLLVLTITSCHDNDNWVIIEDVQPGNYVTGDATIYSAASTSASFKRADLDGFEDVNDVLSIYTWLKAGASFNILKVNADGEPVSYGMGSSVASSAYTTYELAADATPFSVSKDALYLLILNNADNQLTIVEADFGVIGDATPGLWNDETKLTNVKFDEQYSTVDISIEGLVLNNKEIKYRFANTWGLAIPYQGATVTVHSNMGGAGSSTSALTAAFSECKGGGQNFKINEAGVYTINLKYELRSNKFTGKAVCTEKDTSSAKLPENMYIIGSPYGWDWNNCDELIKTHVDGVFWKMFYLNAGDEIKFSSVMAWAGEDFGTESEDAIGFGDYAAGGNNIKIAESGYYLAVVKCTLSADKRSVIKSFSLLQPVVYLVGNTAPGGWGEMFSDAAKFTVEGELFKSPALVADDEIRMCVLIDGVDWWQSEFIFFDGKVAYRGSGGDQERVQGTTGQVITLNFKDVSASIQ